MSNHHVFRNNDFVIEIISVNCTSSSELTPLSHVGTGSITKSGYGICQITPITPDNNNSWTIVAEKVYGTSGSFKVFANGSAAIKCTVLCKKGLTI